MTITADSFRNYHDAVMNAKDDEDLAAWMRADKEAHPRRYAREAFEVFVQARGAAKRDAARVALEWAEYLSEKQIAWAEKIA